LAGVIAAQCNHEDVQPGKGSDLLASGSVLERKQVKGRAGFSVEEKMPRLEFLVRDAFGTKVVVNQRNEILAGEQEVLPDLICHYVRVTIELAEPKRQQLVVRTRPKAKPIEKA
jgi:hypothetical protein